MANVTLYAAPGVPNDTGDGSIASPFSLTTAIDNVPSYPIVNGVPDMTVSGTILLARGDYAIPGGGWIPYTDKRIAFIGQALWNESPDPPTHNVFVQPYFTTGGGYIEFQRTNCAVQPVTLGSPGGAPVSIVGHDAYIEAFGTDSPNYFLSGSPQTTRMGQKVNTPGTVGSVHATNAGVTVGPGPFLGNVDITTSFLVGDLLALPSADGASTLSGCTFVPWSGTMVVTTAHPLTLNACFFDPSPGTAEPGAVIFETTGAGSIITDLLTYRRCLAAGGSFPTGTVILDQCVDTRVMPSLVAAGTGVNSLGNLTLSYPENAAGDLFVAQLNCAGGASVPATPSGWTLQYSKANAGIVGYVYTRDARSTGNETGSVTWSMATEGAPKQGSIYSFRNVATSSFIESETDFISTDGVGHGPTVTPAGSGRLACVFFASNHDAPLTDPITGNTGGTWAFRFAQYSGISALLQLQTAELSSNTAVSGGSCSLGGGSLKVAGIAFALVGAVG